MIFALFPFLFFFPILSLSTPYIFPNNHTSGPSDVQSISDPKFALDGPKVLDTNSSTYDWWYFDAASRDTNASIVAIFYRGAKSGFPFLLNNSDASVNLFFTGEDGVLQYFPVNNAPGDNGSVVLSTYGDGASGVWQGTGFSFFGSGKLERYEVIVNAPELGINGSLALESIAPPHYPCTTATSTANQTLQVSPHVFWANAIPDAIATADFTVNGVRTIISDGVGYHDKNWGDAPFAEHVRTWSWGHGHLGPYSVVWLDAVHPDGKEYGSGYVARDGKILTSTCGEGSAKVRARNGTESSTAGSGSGSGSEGGNGFTVQMEVDGETVEIELSAGLAVYPGNRYHRWMGHMQGMINGTLYTGRGLWEEFIMG